MRRPDHRTAHPDRVLLCQPVHRIFAAVVCVMVRDQNVRNILIQIRTSDAFGKIKNVCAAVDHQPIVYQHRGIPAKKSLPYRKYPSLPHRFRETEVGSFFSPFSVLFGLEFADCPHCSIFCFVMQEFFRTFSRSGSFRRKFVRKS